MRCLLACLIATSSASFAAQDPRPPQPPVERPAPPPPPKPGEAQQEQQPPKQPATDAAKQATQQPLPPRERPRPADRSALLRLFAAMPGLEATYTEEKQLALLAVPLRSSGRILFLPPGYLHRAVETPAPASLLITPDELRLQDREHTEQIDLARSDTMRTFITSLVQVFAGNEAALQKAFTVEFQPDPKTPRGWTLDLQPKEPKLQQMMRQLQLRGEGEAVLVIEVVDPNGDRTTTRIVTADVGRKFDAAEKKRWFGIEPK